RRARRASRKTPRWCVLMESEGWVHSGQHELGCEALTSIVRPCSVIWMCSTRIPSGRESRDASSIVDSLLRENGRLDETISLFADPLQSKRTESPKSGHEPRYSSEKTKFLFVNQQ